MNEIFQSLEKLFTTFSLGRLLFWTIIVAVALKGLIIYEGLSGHFALGEMERKAALLKELHALAKEGIPKDEHLRPAYLSLVEQVKGYHGQSITQLDVDWRFLVSKFWVGTWLGLLLFLWLFTQIVIAAPPTEDSPQKTAANMLGLAIFGGVLSLVVPRLAQSLYLHGLILALSQLSLLLALTWLQKRHRKKQDSV
ncbi:hypothetical protein ATI61_102403 [Archangium gephyra]|uniref:Uncharacterized protein n=1 Tax=Archangium gephyra TaxID=48 RepID=A0ABX9K8P4_9BACT|nr:hypothetical protein [Archangium gephyra]REG36029.1 hypothetical protein ATI61_102403 [Archangium gephyra]